MVWKPGQSGNFMGRPRAAYHWDGEKIVEDKPRHDLDYKAAIMREAYKYSTEKLQDQYKEAINNSIKNGVHLDGALSLSKTRYSFNTNF
jgi:hypothetical protein